MIVCLSVRLSTHGTGGGELSVCVGGGGGVCMCTCACTFLCVCTVFVCVCARTRLSLLSTTAKFSIAVRRYHSQSMFSLKGIPDFCV